MSASPPARGAGRPREAAPTAGLPQEHRPPEPQAQSAAWAPGAVVRLTGLKAAAQLNGELGRLERFDGSSGRWEVKLREGDSKAIKAENLVPATAEDIRAAPHSPPSLDAVTADAAPKTPPQHSAPPAASSSAPSGAGVAGLSSASLVSAPPATLPAGSQPRRSGQPKTTSRRFGTVRWYNGRRKLGSIIPDDGDGDLFIPAQGAPNGSQVPPQPGGLFHGTRVSYMPMALKRDDAAGLPASGKAASGKAAADVVCMDVRALAGQLGLSVGVGTDNGAKEKNDDRLAATDVLELGFLAGVFDGHRGHLCAEYVAKQLPQAISSTYRARAKRERNLVKLTHQQEASLISGALAEAFEAVDKAWMVTARKKEWLDGSTGIVALLCHGFEVPLHAPPAESLGCAALWPKPETPEAPEKQPGTVPRALGGVAKLFVAWCGDCRAVLLRGRTGLRVSEDHRPNKGEERNRIQRAGGMVVQDARGVWRVGPRADNKFARELQRGKRDPSQMKCFLSTSRSFGDSELKSPDPVVIATPEVRVIDLVPEDWAVLVGSDGLFDKLSDQTLADMLWKSMAVQGRDPVRAARDAVQMALRAGSRDNITAVVMRLG